MDLSELNKDLSEYDVDNPDEFQVYIDKIIQNYEFAYGGYLENRAIYKRSKLFKNAEKFRSIHLGVDIWKNAGTLVNAPLDSEIHSLKYNSNYGDYGATIILKHNLEGIEFHTLYGHLSISSLIGKSEGDFIAKSQVFADLGDRNENGNWPSHLHFQIIDDMRGNKGDYPGVCASDEVEYYSKNCPNPELILNFKK
jgi:murein DD-endopeptidase MepM/ murein hydrolase activator NlpD